MFKKTEQVKVIWVISPRLLPRRAGIVPSNDRLRPKRNPLFLVAPAPNRGDSLSALAALRFRSETSCSGPGRFSGDACHG